MNTIMPKDAAIAGRQTVYRNEEEFVRGQKTKLILIAVLMFLAWAANGFHLHGMLK